MDSTWESGVHLGKEVKKIDGLKIDGLHLGKWSPSGERSKENRWTQDRWTPLGKVESIWGKYPARD